MQGCRIAPLPEAHEFRIVLRQTFVASKTIDAREELCGSRIEFGFKELYRREHGAVHHRAVVPNACLLKHGHANRCGCFPRGASQRRLDDEQGLRCERRERVALEFLAGLVLPGDLVAEEA